VSSKRLGLAVAVIFWVTLFRLLFGVVTVIDGLEKLGWMTSSPASAAAGEIHPSPLGPLSPILQILAGMFILLGLYFRTTCLVLGAHLGLGVLVAKLRHSVPARTDATCFIVGLFITGPQLLSIDHFWPKPLRRLFARWRREAPAQSETQP
jgi:uncharacterized membrane protein YphA (DoxX/SURF4 family)